MRIAGAVLILSFLAWSASAPAQNLQPTGKPRPAAAAPKKPAVPPGRDLNTGMALAGRVLIQFDLAWTGEYNGLINGEFNDRTVAAIKAFQKDNQLKETGTLTPPERALLATHSKTRQDEVGWRMVDDKTTGAQVGLPSKQVPNSGPGKTGTRWFSGQGQIQVETFRIREPGTKLADVLDQQKQQPAGRHVDLNVTHDDYFVLSGMQGLKKFYVRAAIRDGEVRGMTLLYDQATEGVMDRVAVVMSSAFAPFPGTGIAALLGTPTRRKVEYATGIVVSAAGHIVTDAQSTAGCEIIEIAGSGDADRVATDETQGLALLRIYGADLMPAAVVNDAGKGPDLTLVGIADPQAQGGGNAVSTTTGRLDGDVIQPAPAPGFDGAAVLDNRGRLIGMVARKDPVVAGGGGAPAPQTTMVPVAAIAKLLDAQHVTPSTGRPGVDAIKAALVRVICVRR